MNAAYVRKCVWVSGEEIVCGCLLASVVLSLSLSLSLPISLSSSSSSSFSATTHYLLSLQTSDTNLVQWLLLLRNVSFAS